jgi:hypothetical protein
MNAKEESSIVLHSSYQTQLQISIIGVDNMQCGYKCNQSVQNTISHPVYSQMQEGPTFWLILAISFSDTLAKSAKRLWAVLYTHVYTCSS